MKGLGFEFTIQLSNWIRDTKFSEVLILTGLDKIRRIDVQLSGYYFFKKIIIEILIT